MVNNYQFPYSKIIREDGEVIPAKDHNLQENQLECLTDALGNYNFLAGSVETRLQNIVSDISDIDSAIAIIQSDIGTLEFNVATLQVDLASLEVDLASLEVRVTTLENEPDPALNDLTDVNAPTPDPGDVLTYVGGTWEPKPAVTSLAELEDVDISGAQPGDSLVLEEGTGTGDTVWAPGERRINVASGLPGSIDESEVFPVKEIRFISDSDAGQDHQIIQVGDGIAYIGAGPPPGALSLLSGLAGLSSGRMSNNVGPTTYPPALSAGDIYPSLTQNGIWSFDTVINEFRLASTGSLILMINGVDVANIDLAANFIEGDRIAGQNIAANYNTQGSGDPVAGGVVAFPGGTLTLNSVGPFNGILVDLYQIGAATVDLTAPALRKGYNIVELRHVNTSGTDMATLEWFYDTDPDGDPNDPDVTGQDLSENTPVLNYLSGVSYYGAGSTFDLGLVGNDCFNNVYHTSEAPIVVAPVAPVWTAATSILISDGSVGGVSAPPVLLDVMTVAGLVLTVNAGVQNGDAIIDLSPRDPYATYANVTTPSKNFAIMSTAPNSTDVFDGFVDERYRLSNLSNFDVPVVGMPGAPLLWDSTVSLTVGARTGELQVYDHTEASVQHRIKYPGFDYSAPANFQPQLNPDYSVLPGGSRAYYRVFRSTSGDKTNGIITFPGVTEADLGAGLGLRVKVPSKTVWLDLSVPFNGGTFPVNALLAGGIDDEGCRINSGVHSLDIDGSIEFSLGAIGTDVASDRQLIIEITYVGVGVTEVTGAGAGLSINW